MVEAAQREARKALRSVSVGESGLVLPGEPTTRPPVMRAV